MHTYIITRPNGWADTDELKKVAEVSARIGNEIMPDKVRWIRSYVTKHKGGRVGTVCVYQGVNPEAVIEHARRVGMPCDTIHQVLDTVILRPDPTNV